MELVIIKSILQSVKEVFINGNFLEEIPKVEEGEEGKEPEEDKRE